MKRMGTQHGYRITLSLAIIAALIAGAPAWAGVTVPTPEVRQSAWQCRAAPDADWSCQRHSGGPFEFTLEQVARPTVPQSSRNPMSWPAHAYTIQLIAVSDPHSLKRLRQQHPDLLRATEVQIEVKNRPLHLLLWGHYPSREAAQAALERFSQSNAGTLKPWIRPLDNLQKLHPRLIADQS